MNYKHLFIIPVFVLILNIQYSYAQKLTRQEMITDINHYFDILKYKHPNLYKQYTPIQFDSLQHQLISQVIDSMECKEFNRLLAGINCFTDGHTQILNNKMWGSIEKRDSLPYFSVDKDCLLLDNHLVLSINNKEVNNIVSEVSNTLSWEYNPLLKEKFINFYLPLYMEMFYNIYPPYTICMKDLKSDKIKEITIEENKLLHRANYNEKFNFEFFEREAIAVLHYNSCNLSPSDIRMFNTALAAAFSKMKNDNTKYLFIDVTKNGGGSTDNNQILFDHLKTKKDKVKLTIRFNKAIIKSLLEDDMKYNKEYVRSAEISFFQRLKYKYIIKRLERKLPHYIQTGTITRKENYPKNKHGFAGQVFVIQSRETYSAAIGFVTDFRRKQAGIVVGEKAGAPVDFCGNIENDTLPNSKIALVYPINEILYSPSVKTSEDGFLIPDIPYDVFHKDLKINDYKEIIELSKNLK